MNHITDFQDLLQKYKALPDTLKGESIFDIAGFPHYENVCSNILAFYLNPKNEHGLGDLFLSALISTFNKNQKKGNNIEHFRNVQVDREVTTLKKGRIDLVVETDNQIIGIENKIYHHLTNDLDDYNQSLIKLATEKQKSEVLLIILSIRKEKESDGFISITYDEYWKTIKENIGLKVTTSSQKWLLYAIDFMDSINKISGGNMEITENEKFLINNEDQINALLENRDIFRSKLNKKVRDLLSLIDKPEKCEKQWIYQKSCLVHDFNLAENQIALDLYCEPKGWRLELFSRNPESEGFLKKVTSEIKSQNNLDNIPYIDSRYTLAQYSLQTDISEIKNKLEKWVKLLLNASKII